jgi:hypothetical protein
MGQTPGQIMGQTPGQIMGQTPGQIITVGDYINEMIDKLERPVAV